MSCASNADDIDLWVLKLNENGEIPNCSIMGVSEAIVSDSSAVVGTTGVSPQSSSVTPLDTTVTPQDTEAEVSVICCSPSIDEILTFFMNGVADEVLIGNGPGNSAEKQLNAIRNMLVNTGNLIEAEDYDGACQQLEDIYKKCDGADKPLDFVIGVGEPDPVSELVDMINSLMICLVCD